MYAEKAAFFDAQAGARWSAAEYGAEEAPKLERLFAHIGPLDGLAVLEPGCGTGRLTAIVAGRVGPRGRVLAMDVSPGMVGAARARLADVENAEVRLCALEERPPEPQSMDLILCHQVFPHIADQPAALRCMASSLRPGGGLVIHHFINSATINDHHRKAGSAVEHDTMPAPGAMRAMLGEAGFGMQTLLDDDLGYLLTARLL